MDLDRYNYLQRRDIKLAEIIPDQMLELMEMLIHWIFQVGEQNNLEIKTIELAAILSKLYLSKQLIDSDRVYLIGIVSLMIAVKFNECQNKIQMNIQDCVNQCQSKYSSKEITDMEMSLLSLIEYDANITTITDYYDGEAVQIDLVLFVTLDSEFLYFQKYELYEAIRNFYSKDTSNLSENTKNIIKRISAKINQLTANDENNTPKIKRKTIKKKKFRRSRFYSQQSITL
ncbi:unnamed protein product (macronuclear) [Paramecium tetraurelia]|uniref:Cyclin-like domain-containing protein n=1 Tax=Paramecium tetraurelia TaxID=5888 RepID=A0C5H6_PARTE|nr:uncharacterized protein GSPATT00006542001 [Paramecium tetraurelia]CAK66043.1 unnamed protein product [Paramecium tetraurelia]|eukprot:XP_001433440.1 hypothetical protein (macronuclear) [Paramecium tetraurelia strain d4-2]